MEILVKYENGTRFSATCDKWTVTTGKGDDGNEARDGMYPAQMFAASIGMCVGGYVLHYCEDHDIPYDDMTIEVDRQTAKHPSRTTKVSVNIRLGAPVSEQHAAGILRAADRCHITNSIRGGLEIACSLDAGS